MTLQDSKKARRRIFALPIRRLAAGWVALAALGACSNGADHENGRSASTVGDVTLVIYGSVGNPFWSKVVAGAKEAGDRLGVGVNVQFAENDPLQQNAILETALVNRTAGLGIVIDQDGAYDANIARARSRNIPVIAFNIDSPRGEASGRQAFVGQDFGVAGFALGKRMASVAKLGQGDVAACPVEHPEASYAAQRLAGVNRALAEVGARCEVVNTGSIGPEDTLTKLTQYLIGHPRTAAVISLGSLPTEVAPQALDEAGVDIPNGGFDLSKAIVNNVMSGRTAAVVDQQPFYQGFMTVAQLYYARRYGLAPMSVNTGAAIIDRKNAGSALAHSDRVR